ncbi:AMP phosphorylase [Candidatus Parvarchaeota archaeon]|jgi:AMP phosphorylase|nr:MAG: AMP phosphorylase [Candidatus Parvarchaeota archaeon]HIG51951.1 AMP phosphorylase [Candidatus Pacearchaeota archaeon]
MRLKVRKFQLKAGKPIAFVHQKDAEKLNINVGERIEISYKDSMTIGIVDVVSGFIKSGEIALSEQITNKLKLKSKYVNIGLGEYPKSTKFLKKKLNCIPYKKSEIKKIINEIVKGSLTEAEVAYFISGINYCGMNLEETKYLTEAIFESGKKIKWKQKNIADKHSIGGVPGNRTTPIVVSICSAVGIIMPKTSSRAITSAAGTADVIESIAKVNLSIDELKSVVKKTGACLAWGGSLGLAPADDKIIQTSKIIRIDPEPQLLASILAKKLSVGSKFVLIDIPHGSGAKVSLSKARSLKDKFIKIGKKLGLKIRVLLTDGSQPIGNGIGPILEVRDILKVLRREDSPKDLENKSLKLAGELLEMVGKAKNGKGRKKALEILNSGKAYKKFEEIIKAQSGSFKYLEFAKYKHEIKFKKSGKVKSINNKDINYLTRLTGCPLDKKAGIYLHKHKRDKIKKGETIITIYSESKHKLNQALNFYKIQKPIRLG